MLRTVNGLSSEKAGMATSNSSPLLVGHLVAADHDARRRLQRAARRVAERFARLDDRRLADDARAAHFFASGPAPSVMRQTRELQLHRLVAVVGDLDGVGPEEMALLRGRLVVQVLRGDADADAAGHGFVHAAMAPCGSRCATARF